MGSGINGYDVQLAKDSLFTNIVKSLSVTATNTIIEDLSNATYYMRVRSVDNAGNKSEWTEVKSIIIDRDITPPTVSNVKADITAPTNGNVTITATFSDDRGAVFSYYRIGELDGWRIYEESGVTVSNNNTVYFKAIDTSGNESEEVSYQVTNIDKTPPAKPTASANITTHTMGSVIVTASFSSDSAIREYSLDGKTWSAYSGPITFESNGTAYFRGIDEVGNISEITSYVVGNIDAAYISGAVITKEKRTVSSGQIYANTTVNDGGIMYVSSGGIASSTQINYNGNACVFRDGTMESTTVNSGGLLTVESGGIANNSFINSGTLCIVYSGGTATNVKAFNGANLIFACASNTLVQGTYNGSSFEMKNAYISGYTINSGSIWVYNGGRVDNTTINANSWLDVLEYGCVANNTTVSAYGNARINGAGTANNTVVNSRGYFQINDRSMANSTLINSGGSVDVCGGIINGVTVNSGGYLVFTNDYPSYAKLTGQITVKDGAIVSCSSDSILDFDLTQTSAGAESLVNNLSLVHGMPVYTLTVSDSQTKGIYKLAEGASMFNSTITVQSVSGTQLGALTIGETKNIGGTDYFLKLNEGVLSLSIGTDTVAPTVSNIKADILTLTNQNVTVTADFTDDVELAQSLYRIGETGTWIDYEGGVTVYENTAVYFKAVDTAGNESQIRSYDVRNIDKVAPSTPSGLKALKDDQDVVLIWNASTDNLAGVKEYIVKYSNNSQEYTVQTSNTNYMLSNLASGSWKWSVQAVDAVGNISAVADGAAFNVADVVPEPETKDAAKGDIDGNGISDVMFVWAGTNEQPGNYQHGYWLNGTNEWQSANSGHPAEWENLGCHDMTGDGKADSVLVGNVVVNDVKGAYIGYYADANDTPDGSTWVNIGYLNNADDISWCNKVGNLTGGSANSIVWYAPELYALGAWKDGKEDWVSLSGNFGGDAWTLVGCGDFDGDGKDSVVMTLNKGQLFYSVGIEDSPTTLGSADWSGWEVRAIGDFAGDGKDDMILFHKEYGAVVMLADGNLNNYTSIGQLDAKDWFIVGAGDYDGDHKDDLLVRQYSTGMLGYYSACDTSKWNVLGYGVDMTWTVIA